MEKYRERKITLGMSVIEVMLATVMFAILATGGIATIVHSFSVNRRGEEETQATLMAQEGIEAVRSIKNKGWANLSAGTTGVATTGNTWGFDGNPDVNGRFTRTIQIDQVMRNSSGVIVNSGGTVDPDTMKVTFTSSTQKKAPLQP
jgi:type II secretory pathway pseudopilin PulG